MTNKNYGWPTTRRFPNTMSDAFPNDVEHAQWFYPPDKRRGLSNALMLIAGCVLWGLIGYLLVKGSA